MKVGTVVVGQHFKNAVYRNGQEGVIIDAERLRTCRNSHTGIVATRWQFKVLWCDGTRSNVSRLNLRPKRPPSGELKITEMFKNPVNLPELV